MGFLDKAKAQASQLAAKAQEGVKQGQAKLDGAQANKKAEGLLAELGAWTWARKHGRDEGRADAEIVRVSGELAAHEAEHGVIASPAQTPEPAPFPEPVPPQDASSPAPPAAPSDAVPPAPPAAAPAAPPPPPPVPEGGFSLDDL